MKEWRLDYGETLAFEGFDRVSLSLERRGVREGGWREADCIFESGERAKRLVDGNRFFGEGAETSEI